MEHNISTETPSLFNKMSLSLHTLPVELVYIILDKLNDKTIFFSCSNVCTRLNDIVNTYRRYQVISDFNMKSYSHQRWAAPTTSRSSSALAPVTNESLRSDSAPDWKTSLPTPLQLRFQSKTPAPTPLQLQCQLKISAPAPLRLRIKKKLSYAIFGSLVMFSKFRLLFKDIDLDLDIYRTQKRTN